MLPGRFDHRGRVGELVGAAAVPTVELPGRQHVHRLDAPALGRRGKDDDVMPERHARRAALRT
jgi:hypothetical protein